jgi:hypothetical protein
VRNNRLISTLAALAFFGVVIVGLYIRFTRTAQYRSGTTGVTVPVVPVHSSAPADRSSAAGPERTATATDEAGSPNSVSRESAANLARHMVSARSRPSTRVSAAGAESQATTRQSTTLPGDTMSEDIRTAMREFREKPFRVAQARKLIPLLRPGLEGAQVEGILGPPSEQIQRHEGVTWFYVVGYSQSISVFLDKKGKVVSVDSSVSADPDEAKAR